MRDESAGLRALLAERDPELLLAIEEVDRTLIRSSLRRAPWDRVRDSFEQHDTLQEMARCLRSSSEALIAAGRVKDRLTVPILIATLEERERVARGDEEP